MPAPSSPCSSASSHGNTHTGSPPHKPAFHAFAQAHPVPVSVRLRRCLQSTLQSRYFYANVVYLFYCTGMLCIDFVDYGKEINDKLYYFFGVVHFLNAWTYWYAWKHARWWDPIVYPEYVNVLGAALYLWSSALYRRESGPHDAATSQVHIIETSAAIAELLACVGWAITWHLTYVRVPGRGYTLDDPDIWALLTIFTGAIIYVVYNVQILAHPSWYGKNEMYFWGDVFYAMNGVLYLLAGLRDDGWFWWMPLAGSFSSFSSASSSFVSSSSSTRVEAEEEEVQSQLLAVVVARETEKEKEEQLQVRQALCVLREGKNKSGVIDESDLEQPPGVVMEFPATAAVALIGPE